MKQAVLPEDRLAALEARVAQMETEMRALHRASEKARGTIALIGTLLEAHETVLMSLVHFTPLVALDIDAGLAHPNFVEIVGVGAVERLREFRDRLDEWRAVVEAAQRPDDAPTH